ncbi:hypothetical protein EMMF5_000758 [Cystobasidiomycetes sp. EMM_F5]
MDPLASPNNPHCMDAAVPQAETACEAIPHQATPPEAKEEAVSKMRERLGDCIETLRNEIAQVKSARKEGLKSIADLEDRLTTLISAQLRIVRTSLMELNEVEQGAKEALKEGRSIYLDPIPRNKVAQAHRHARALQVLATEAPSSESEAEPPERRFSFPASAPAAMSSFAITGAKSPIYPSSRRTSFAVPSVAYRFGRAVTPSVVETIATTGHEASDAASPFTQQSFSGNEESGIALSSGPLDLQDVGHQVFDGCSAALHPDMAHSGDHDKIPVQMPVVENSITPVGVLATDAAASASDTTRVVVQEQPFRAEGRSRSWRKLLRMSRSGRATRK